MSSPFSSGVLSGTRDSTIAFCPDASNLTGPAGWTRDPAAKITVRAEDPGLGVRQLKLHAPEQPAWNGTRDTEPVCNGDRHSRCPTWRQHTVEVGDLLEGRNRVVAEAVDPVARRDQQEISVDVDRTPPTIALRGSMYEGRGQVIAADKSTLGFTVDDGDTATIRSGVTNVSVTIDGRSYYDYSQACPSGGCGRSDSIDVARLLLAAGEHRVEVTARDGAGNPARPESFTFSTPHVEVASTVDAMRDDPAEENSDLDTLDTYEIGPCEDEPEISVICPGDTLEQLEPALEDDSEGAERTTQSIRAGAYGFSDQKSAVFDLPAFKALKTEQARLIVPFDIVARYEAAKKNPPETLTYSMVDRNGTRSTESVPPDAKTLEDAIVWMNTIRKAGHRPMVSFEGTRHAPARGYLPSGDVYRKAIEDFLSHAQPNPAGAAVKPFDAVRDFSPWNEPNIDGQPTSVNKSGASGPFAAGRYFRIMRSVCKTRYPGSGSAGQCKVAAGEFLDEARLFEKINNQASEISCRSSPTPDCASYFERYVRGLRGETPTVWALHAYRSGTVENAPSDPENGMGPGQGSKLFRRMVREIDRMKPGRAFNAWLTEQGGRAHILPSILKRSRRDPADPLFQGAVAADKDLDFILKLPTIKIDGINFKTSRFYLYNWNGGWSPEPGSQPFDSGLTDYTKATTPRDVETDPNIDGPLRDMYCAFKLRSDPVERTLPVSQQCAGNPTTRPVCPAPDGYRPVKAVRGPSPTRMSCEP